MGFPFAFIALLLGGLTLPGMVSADVIVVASRDSTLRALTQEQISDLYLGRIRSLPNGVTVNVLDHPRDSMIRNRFFFLLNGMTLKQLNAYWARLQFSGRVLPPSVLSDSNAMLIAVRANPEAIGYVDAAVADDSVRVLLRLKDGG